MPRQWKKVVERRKLILQEKRSGKTRAEISEKLGISRSRASALLRWAIIEEKMGYYNPPNTVTMDTVVYELDMSLGARKCLLRHDVRTVGDILKLKKHELFQLRGIGTGAFNEIKNAILPFEIAI